MKEAAIIALYALIIYLLDPVVRDWEPLGNTSAWNRSPFERLYVHNKNEYELTWQILWSRVKQTVVLLESNHFCT